MSENQRQALIILLFACLLAVGSIFKLPIALSAFVGLFGLFWLAALVGPRLFPTSGRLGRVPLGLLTLLAVQSIIQTVWYYSGGNLDRTSDLTSIGLTALFSALLIAFTTPVAQPTNEVNDQIIKHKTLVSQILWITASVLPVLIALVFLIYHAYSRGTDAAIRTPWLLLPRGSQTAFILLSIAPLLATWKVRSRHVASILSALSLAIVPALLLLLYKIGFGFDGFLHRASELVLLQSGTLVPKPPYYIGQYVFVTWFARLFQLPVGAVDKLLLPISLLFIPFAAALAFRSFSHGRWTPVFLFSFLPLASLITTTPQTFAYVVGLLALLFAYAEQRDVHAVASFTLALWSVAIHPLAGLPFFGMTFLLLWLRLRPKPKLYPWHRTVSWLTLFAIIISIPLAFAFNNLHSANRLIWRVDALATSAPYQTAWRALLAPPRNHVALWSDWTLLVEYLFPLVLFALAIWIVVRMQERRREHVMLLLASLGSALAGWFLQSAADFSFLISYERNNYAERLYIVAALLLLTPALQGVAYLTKRLIRRPPFVIATALIFLAAWNGARAYAAYPRHDTVTTSHTWSVGYADQEAARWIERDAQGQPYTVLANQLVSAAAIELYGFKRYAASDIFYYPLPTGGPLYQIFLRAASPLADRDLIQQAANLGQSNRVYVVVNDYWWKSEQTAQVLERISDAKREFGNGKVKVYEFTIN